MDYPTKICPRCQTKLKQEDGAFELVRRETGSFESSVRLPVTVFSCLKCGYIELYDLKVVGRI